MYNDAIEALNGRTIYSVWVEKNRQHFLKFCTDDGDVYFYAAGDCCSESWFADITGGDALQGAVVLNAYYIDMPQEEYSPRSRQDIDIIYGFVIETAKGRCTVVFRNSSNGYYGGWLAYESTAEEASYLGNGTKITQPISWEQIHDEYSA